MKPQDHRDEIAHPKRKAPYERPELKKIGKLCDVTAVTASIGVGDELEPS